MAVVKTLYLPTIALLLFATMPLQAAGPKQLLAPDDVKTGLRILNQVVGHTGRLIASKNFDSVPREHHEILEGAEILREAVDKEPEAFRNEVDGKLDEVEAASSALEDPRIAHDAAKLAAANTALAAAVHRVLDEFPQDLQPTPRN